MDAKTAARRRLESQRDPLVELSHRIHAHPELGFEEERSSTWLCESLADLGFAVEPGICDLATALRARFGNGPLNVAICAEYDSLPGIGHACGHNVIAASTDMGNVSLAVPSIHPTIGINSLPAVNHQPEFTAHCVTPDADKALADGALAMAWTCIDLANDAALRQRLIARA